MVTPSDRSGKQGKLGKLTKFAYWKEFQKTLIVIVTNYSRLNPHFKKYIFGYQSICILFGKLGELG